MRQSENANKSFRLVPGANYTFACCWSDARGGQPNKCGWANGRVPWVQGAGGFRADYGRCSSTTTKVFKLSGEYELLFGRGARWATHADAAEDAIVSGWKLDPVSAASSDFLPNISCQGTNGYRDNSNFIGKWFQTSEAAWGCNAPTAPGQHLYGPRPRDITRTRIAGFSNSSAFTAPQYPIERIGQQDFSLWGVRGNQVYGPGGYNLNLPLHKSVKTSDATSLEIMAESFNILNHPWFNNPDSNPHPANYTNPGGDSLSGGLGTITGDLNGPRTWELASQFIFYVFPGKTAALDETELNW